MSVLPQNLPVLSAAESRLRDRLLVSAEDFDPSLHPPGTEYLLVHNPGKVGSKSIVETLKREVPRARVFHSHSLSLEALARAEDRMGRLPRPLFRPLEASWKIRRIYLRHRGRLKWKLFVSFRDPVARDISLFFELIHHRYPKVVFESGEMDEARVRAELREFLAGDTDLEYMPPQRDWFGEELEGLFEMPVYETPFDVERGWARYENAHGDRAVVMRMERIDEVLGDAAAALGLALSRVHRANDAEAKIEGGNPYYAHYEAVRRAPDLPPGFLDSKLASPFARHFFSDAQRDAMDARWRPFSP